MQRRFWMAALCGTALLATSPLLRAQALAADAFVKQVSADVIDAVIRLVVRLEGATTP